MRIAKSASASIVAIAVAATLGSVSAAGPSDVPPVKPTSSSPLAALKGVKAVPMTASELDAVKGQHIHFVVGAPETCPGPACDPVIPKAPADAAPPLDGPIFLVNYHEDNLGKGQALPGSGPGYSGMCGAALKSPALWIPGQLPSGSGGGC
jgi:hypothetical protein